METTQDQQTLPLTLFARKDAKPNTLLQRVTLLANTNNIADVNYTQGGTNNHKLIPLCNMFCDNCVLYYDIELPATKSVNPDEIVAQHLPEYTARIVRVFGLLGITVNKQATKATSYIEQTSCLRQYIKVALQDAPYSTTIKLCTNKTVMQILRDNGLHINDIDFTRDYTGVIDKEEVIQHLLQTEDYSTNAEDYTPYHILSNDNAVSKNCLTILQEDLVRVRYKFYNKFVQMVESPSVRNAVGNHYANWINCPEHILRDTIPKATETGLLRLETTFYIRDTALTEQYIQQRMQYLEQLLPPHLIYYNPIQTQWNLLLSCVLYNMLVIDMDNNTALYSYYCNKTTNKITGFYIDTNKYDVNKILQLHSFNLPIVVLRYNRDGENLVIQQQCYEKVLQPNTSKQFTQLTTWLVGSKQTYSKYKVVTDAEATKAVGLVDNPIVTFRETHNNTKIPITLQPIPNILSLDKMRSYKDKRDSILEDDFIRRNNELIQQIRQQNERIDNIEQQHLQQYNILQQQIEQIRQEQQHTTNYIQTLLDKASTQYHNLLELPDRTSYAVYAYKDISTQHKRTQSRTRYVLAVSSKPCNTLRECIALTPSVTVQLYTADKTLRDYLYYHNDDIGDGEWSVVNNIYYCRTTGLPLFRIRRNGYKYDAQKHKQPIIDIEECWEAEYSDEEDDKPIQDTEHSMQELKLTNTVEFQHKPICSKCKKIDDIVRSGDVVQVIDVVPFKGSYLVRCKCNGTEYECKSNKWLDDLLVNRVCSFIVVASVVKRHPIAKRRCISFVL